jgi:hypothetical protein
VIAPMRDRWERALQRFDEEKDSVRRELERSRAETTDTRPASDTPTIRLPEEELSNRR